MNKNREIVLHAFCDIVFRLENHPLLQHPKGMSNILGEGISKQDLILFRALVLDARPILFLKTSPVYYATICHILAEFYPYVEKGISGFDTVLDMPMNFNLIYSDGTTQLTAKEAQEMIFYGEGVHYRGELLIKAYHTSPTDRSFYYQDLQSKIQYCLGTLSSMRKMILELQTNGKLEHNPKFHNLSFYRG